ncbi:MAG TPA: site-specific integrase [Candidatus Lambdaproteobacteria bacterium]|nr:site-specific integrase [Candidatus Lambdaproteobacteria bacterium]
MSVKLRQKKIAAGKISLYLDIYHNGHRQYDFLKLQLLKGTDSRIKAMNKETLELAETIRANRQTELQYSEYDFIPSFKRNADFVEYFKKLSENRGGSRPVWQNVLKHLKTYTGGKVAFKGINIHWLEKWQDYLLKQVSRNTAQIYFSITKSSLNQSVKDGILSTNPCNRVTNIKREDTERQFLTFEEVKQLSCSIPKTESGKEVAKMFLFGCFTGLSLANLEQLTFEQIEGDTVKFFRTKTKTWQYVPLSKTALSLIGEPAKKEATQIVFKVTARTKSNTLLKEWGKQAGIRKNMHFHLSRHTFATLTLSSGGDLYTVSKLLGHKELATTQIYAKVIDETKRKAVNAIPQLEL